MNREQLEKHDAVVRVHLRARDAGGRTSAIPNTMYRCPVFFDEQREQANDCVFFFNQTEEVAAPGGPGVQVPVNFLVPELVAEKLKVGARFTLWEGRDIGEAEILSVPTR
jgi:hypothetical protein